MARLINLETDIPMRNLVRLLFAVPAVALMTATAAGAHIVFAEPNAPAGGYYVGFLRVSHGCAGLSTVSIRVSIPAEIMVAFGQQSQHADDVGPVDGGELRGAQRGDGHRAGVVGIVLVRAAAA